MTTIDDDNGEVLIRKMVQLQENLLEDNIQMELTIMNYHNETRSPLQTGPWRLKQSVGPAEWYLP
jgi:hypothetical protein